MSAPVPVTKAVTALKTGGINALRSAESGALSAGGLYTGTGRDEESTQKPKISKSKKISLLILLSVGISGGVFLGSLNNLLGPALSSRLFSSTSTQVASYSTRANFLTRYFLKKAANQTDGIFNKKYNTLSGRFKENLKAMNIEVDESGSSRVLIYTSEVDGEPVKTKITADNFNEVYNSNKDFRTAFDTAERPRIVTLFDNSADRIFKKFGITKNSQANFKATGDAEVDLKNYQDTLKDNYNGNTSTLDDVSKHGEDYEYDTDADGNRTIRTDPDTGEPVIKITTGEGSATTESGELTFDEAKTKTSSTIKSVIGSVQSVGTIGCMVAKTTTMISAVMAGMEIANSVKFFNQNMEGVSKMMAGDGSDSGVNTFLNLMTTESTVDITDLSDVKYDSANQTAEAGETQITAAPIQASGLNLMLTDMNDGSDVTSLYSLERAYKSIIPLIGSGLTLTTVCANTDAILSIASIVVTFVPGGGFVKAAGSVFQFTKKIIAAVGVQLTLSTLLSFLVPTIAKVLYMNPFISLKGVEYGEFLAKGAAITSSNLHRTGSGGMGGSSENVLSAYNQIVAPYLAKEAELDRATLSPFDYTNPNTFLGSIAYKTILPFYTSGSFTSLSSFARTAGQSFSSILGGVNAAGENSTYLTTIRTGDDCPLLSEAGMTGDIYCNPITITDPSLIEVNPDDAKYQEVILDSLEDCDENGEGACTIDEDSDLAKFIVACVNRDTPFGAVDQNLLANLSSTGDLNPVTNSILHSIPIIEDLISLVEDSDDTLNLDWANGKKCSASADNVFWQEQGKYYQRYIEDMRILEERGAFEDSSNPVLSYIEDYETKHPIDDSFEGTIARFSGLTLENVNALLAIIDYYNYINEYDPTSRIAFTESTNLYYSSQEIVAYLKQGRLLTDSPIIKDSDHRAIVAKSIIYENPRYRNFAV